MNFLNVNQVVESPCKEVLSYPWQCFREMFLATPAVVGTFFVGIGGFAIAVLIWAAIFSVALFLVFLLAKNLYRAAKYFFTSTKTGRTITAYVPVGKYLQSLCCHARAVQPRKLIGCGSGAVQSSSATGAESNAIYGVSKVQVDLKWFKNALKPFSKATESIGQSTRSPSKTPQRAASRLSALTPKLLSPKQHKQ